MGRKFVDAPDRKDLGVGQHEPCKLESIKPFEPTEELLAKYPDMGPTLCFRFVMHCPDDEEKHGASAVRFVNDTTSKLGALYALVTDLNRGREPEVFDEDDYLGRWYRIRVRKNPKSGKLSVQGADPIDPPKDLEQQTGQESKSTKPPKASRTDEIDGDDIPF